MNKQINLRSDTVTLPTKEMMEAIANAKLGDDVNREDDSTVELEEYAAGLLGKEAALLVTSGTMGNLVAILTHVQSGRGEIIAESMAHIVASEAGNYATLGSIAIRTVKGINGVMEADDVEELIRDPHNLHHPQTSLICMENTHNYAGGTVSTIEQMHAVRKIADKHGIPMHLDGARIFNAALALNVSASDIAAEFDSVQLCLSKGLSAPVGSLIVGDKAFIDEARHYRKMVGGGMRQCGIISAAGLVALKNMRERLVEDHYNARLLADSIKDIPGLGLDMSTVQSNMVRINTKDMGCTGAELVSRLKEKGVICGAQGKYIVRFVVHRHISSEDIKDAAKIIMEVSEGIR